MSATEPPLRGILVSHTHWDRAWYLPFEAFRLRLVRMVDRLLDLLEQEPRFRAFTLDGQTVLLEDYLAFRPQHEDRLRALIAQERLWIGPWYTLPDLFLVAGEAVIRNLQVGQALAKRFGGGLPVGYIPDPFGYFAQLPQVLRGGGLDTLLFMRGMRADLKTQHGALFDWVAPDGSSVLAIYQRLGYFAAGGLGHPSVYGRFDGHAPEPELAEERIQEAVDRMTPLQAERTLLLSNGFDHMPEEPALPDMIDGLNAQMDGIRLEHGSFVDFVEAIRDEGHPHGEYTGDLLGNVDHPILSSVYSTRMYLKRQNHRAQHLLIHVAEPMSAWMAAAGRGPETRSVLERAWKLLLRNHPHDDICGCSVDPVHDEDEVRFQKVEQLADTLRVEQLEALVQEGFAAPTNTGAQSTDVFVFNPHPWPQRFRVEATILLPHPDGAENAAQPAHALAACTADGTDLDVMIRRTTAPAMRNNFLESTWGRRYEVTFTVEVPPLGYQVVHCWERDAPPPLGASDALALEDDAYRLTVTDGGLRMTEKTTGQTFDDALRFEYQLDDGDTYSFGPVPSFTPRWASFERAERPEDRPDALRLHHRLTVPEGYDRERGPYGETTLCLTTDLWLTPHHAVACEVRYENTAKDGRLRIVLPTGCTTRASLADGHFRLAPRTKPPLRTPESAPERHAGYPGELDYPTHHQGDFVMVEGPEHRAWVANRGLPEYELLDVQGDTQIAVTLHRAVGMLSVEGGHIRRCQAGPTVPTPGAQCLRPMGGTLAFGVGAFDRATVVRHARAFAHPAWARELPYLPYVDGDGALPRQQSFLAIDTPHVVLSALKPGPDAQTRTLRLVNLSDAPQPVTAMLGFPATHYCLTDLRERWSDADAQPLSGDKLTLTLGPHAIQTVLLR